MSEFLLHKEHLLRVPIVGESMCGNLVKRAGEVALETHGLHDPNVSVVIRSRNRADQLKELLRDINERQRFDGEVEIILVDTESTDNTKGVARDFGAVVVPILQADFNYPRALNLGFAAASHKWVFSFVDHSLLTNNQILRIATRSEAEPNTAGVSGITLPNANASRTELAGTAAIFPWRVRKPAYTASKRNQGLGFLATNASLISREAWTAVGGFDEAYGAGGEDGAFAKAIMDADYNIVVDPAMSVHHTHGTGFIDSLKQGRYWAGLHRAQPFSRARLAAFREEYRSPEG